MRGSEVWHASDGPHIVRGVVTVEPAATLTIEAGAVVEFTGNLQSGVKVQGHLKIEGARDRPAVLRVAPGDSGSRTSNGYWRGIWTDAGGVLDLSNVIVSGSVTGVAVQNGTAFLDDVRATDSVRALLAQGSNAHVTVIGGAFERNSFAIDAFDGAKVGITGSTLRYNRTAVFARAASVSLDGNVFQGNPFPVVAASDATIEGSGNSWMQHGELRQTTLQAMTVPSAATETVSGVESNTTWNAGEGPVVISGNFEVAKGTTLTIEPGVVVKFEAGGGSGMTVNGKLVVAGTAENPVYFTSSLDPDSEVKKFPSSPPGMGPGAGDWDGIRIGGAAIIENAVVRYSLNGVSAETGGKLSLIHETERNTLAAGSLTAASNDDPKLRPLAVPVGQVNLMPSFATVPAGWTTDRYDPSSFAAPASPLAGRNSQLQIKIDQAQGYTSRPVAYQSSFYDFQGRTHSVAGSGTGDAISADIYVPSAFGDVSQGNVASYLWAVGYQSGAPADYALIGFANTPGAGEFAVWNESDSAWVSVTVPAGAVNYDAWNTVSIRFSGATFDYYVNGALVYSMNNTFGSGSIGGTIMDTFNFFDPTLSYTARNYAVVWADALLSQTITFTALADTTLDAGSVPLVASASSGLTVSFVSTTPSICTIAGDTVTLTGAGTCSITASQAGSATIAAAPNVVQSFTVAPASQSISFGLIASAPVMYGTLPIGLSATATSGLPITFASGSPSVCTVTAATVTIISVGTCTVTASQAGNNSFNAATDISQSFTVIQGAQTIAFGALGNVAAGSAPFPVGATASSGLTVTFTSNSPSVCSVSGNLLTPRAPGTCSITATQNGSNLYSSATPVTQTFSVTATLAITTPSLSSAILNQAYGPVGLAATGGAGGLTWTVVAGSLPSGMSLSSTGTLGGTPTSTGSFPFSVKVSDGSGNSSVIALALQVNPLLSVTTASLPPAIQGIAYTQSLAATGGSGNYTWTLASGTLPAGINLNSSGALTGTTNATGTFSFTVQVGDGNTTSTLSLAITVGQALSITSSATLPNAVTGKAFSTNCTATGGTGGLRTWSVVAGTLPAGLSFSATGGLTGNPSVAGTFSFTIQVADGVSTPASLLVSMTVFTQISVTTTSLPNATAGLPYGPITLAAQGGSGIFSWTATGLPNGVTLSSAGVLGGTPSTVGAATIVATATDSVSGQILTVTIPLNVVAQTTALKLSPSTLVAGAGVNAPVSGAFAASGGVPPYSFSAKGLPTGILLGANGTLSGSSAAAGNFSATVTVTDAEATPASVTSQLTLQILGLTTTSLPAGAATVLYTASFSAAGGTPPYVFSATGLPSGFTLSGSGALSGTASAPTTISFQVQVNDSTGLTSSSAYSLTIHQAPVTASASGLSGGTAGTPYSQTLTATGGNPPYTWSLLNGALPAGLSLAASGTISGIPTTPGTFTFGVGAKDASGGVTSLSVTIAIVASPIVVSSGSFPSGVVSFAYPQQILSATGGVAPYTFTVTEGALPPGLVLSSGVVSGTPVSDGIYPLTITVVDSALNHATLNTTIVIRSATSDLQLLAGSASFSVMIGATGLPPGQAVGVQSTVVSQPVNYTTNVNPTAPWLSVTSSGNTPGALALSLTTAALNLPAGNYVTDVALSCTSFSCSGKTQSLVVTLTVTAPPPQVSVLSTLLAFTTSSTPPQPQTQPLGIQNTGGGTLTIVSVSCEAAWCTAGSFPATLQGGPATQVSITVDPGTLGTGFFRTAVDVVTTAGSVSVPVSFFISQLASMNLAPAGTQFNMPAGGTPGNTAGSFLVSAAGGNLSWAATVLQAPAWLTLNTTSGTASDSQPGTVSYSVNSSAALLPAQAYYATIELTSTGASNSPQDYQVVLNVSQNLQNAPDPQPAGLLFLTAAGGSAPPQVVKVYTSSSTPQSYQAATATTDGGSWLTVAPAVGTTSSLAPDSSLVTIDLSGLAPGVYTGGVSYAFSDAGVRTVNVTLIVQSAGGGSASVTVSDENPKALTPKAACSPTKLVPTQTGLVNNFSAPASWPTPLAIKLADDCGNNVGTGQVTATFSNGDPPLALALADSTAGLYSATWTPRASAAQITITARATATALAAGTAQIVGAVVPNATPVITPHGTVHVFNPQVGAALAPGTIMAIYGSNLAAVPAQPTVTPLPTTLNGTTVLIGGMPSPLYYVSPGQINVQIPFELNPAGQYQVVINANGALATPATIQLTSASPGLDAFPDGTLIAVHALTGALISPTAPAQPGEFIVMFLLGMGQTDNPVTSGNVSPSNPLARPTAAPTLTLNGNTLPLVFAGLTPGFVGLYQINLQIPPGTPGGNTVLTVSQDGWVSNTTILPIAY